MKEIEPKRSAASWLAELAKGRYGEYALSVIVIRASCKFSNVSVAFSFFINLLYALNYFEEPWTPRDSIAFESRRYSKANRFFGTGFVRNNKVGCHGVQTTADALNGSVKTFQVDCDITILFFRHTVSPFFVFYILYYTPK